MGTAATPMRAVMATSVVVIRVAVFVVMSLQMTTMGHLLTMTTHPPRAVVMGTAATPMRAVMATSVVVIRVAVFAFRYGLYFTLWQQNDVLFLCSNLSQNKVLLMIHSTVSNYKEWSRRKSYNQHY